MRPTFAGFFSTRLKLVIIGLLAFAECSCTVGNDFNLTGNAKSTDATNPTILSVSKNADGLYSSGQTLSYSVVFDEPVYVTGSPSIALTVGQQNASATYSSGSGTNVLSFSYTLTSADLDMNGVATTANIVLGAGTIKDSAGNNAVLTTGAVNTSGIIVTTGGVRLWLDSSDSATLWRDSTCTVSAAAINLDQVACWKDKSGRGNNFIQVLGAAYIPKITTAALNSLPVVTLDGVGAHLKGANVYAGGETQVSVLAVFRQQVSPNAEPTLFITNDFTGNWNRGLSLMSADSSNGTNLRFWRNRFDLNYVEFSGATVSSYSITAGVHDGSTLEFWVNSVSKGTAASTGGLTTKTDLNEAFLGAFDWYGGYFKGDVAEIILFDTGLSTASREKMEGYLACKWNLQSTLPGGHPYKTACP